MDPKMPDPEAVELIPSGLFLINAAHDGKRSGVLTRWVQRCSQKPNMITVALPKGMPVEPLIRDSRFFTICQVSADDVVLQRKFATPPDRNDDPFVTLSIETAPSGAPVVSRAMNYLDCELVTHLEFESEFRLYVGLVQHAAVLNQATPAVYFGENGLTA